MTDSTPLIMLAIFFAGTLWLGMRYKKGSRNIVEYTIGNKMFTTSALVATVLATNYGGGGVIRTVQMIYTYGLWFIMLMIGRTTMAYLSRIVVSHRVGVFMGHYVGEKSHISMADTIGKVYGKAPRIITALATVCVVVVDVATQITVTSQILQILISGINPTILVVISASIVVLYSTLGGIQSVTITDILQCATFAIIIPCITYKIFHHTGMSIPQIFKAASQSEKFQFAPIWQNKTKILSLVAIYMAYVGVDPASVQRMYMARNSQQAREAYCASTILDLSILLIIAFLGIVTCVGYGHIADPSMIWPTIMSDSSAIFRGFFVISLFAMAMSTTDSCLNVGSSMLAYDIVNPLRKNKLTDKQQLYLAKVACVAIGMFSIFLSLSVSKYKDALFRLLFLAIDMGNPVMTAPFLLAVFGFRCKERIAVLGMTVGIVTITLWKKFIPDINGSFIAMLANGITMLLAHYSLPDKDRQSWQKPSLDYRQLQQSRQRKFYRFKKYISGLFSKLQYTPSDDRHIVLLAFYILTTSWIPLLDGNLVISRDFNNYHLIYWPLFRCLAALFMIVDVVLNTKIVGHNRYVWLSVLVLCLPVDALWYIAYAQEQRMALALAFCHVGVLTLLLPIYFNLAILALGYSVAAVAGFNTHGLINTYMANIELFLPATLFLASSSYMRYRYTIKSQQVLFFATQQQRAVEQEIQRSNMLHYLDMVTTEQFSEADILAKISAKQAQFFADMSPGQLKHVHIADAMDRFINFAAFFDERARLAQGYLHLSPTSIDLYDLVNNLETALSTHLNYLPKLFVEPSLPLATKITCDVELLTQALKSIVLNLLDEHYWGKLYSTTNYLYCLFLYTNTIF